MNVGDLNKVWEIKALKSKPAADEAHRLLDRIAKQVQPILRRRKWRVKLLSEFSPGNPSLLGLNVGGGVEIKLRLRRPNRDWDFFPFDQVLDTMLHELSHIEHGPHNAAFYKLWDELRAECEELVVKGVTGTGQGFDAPGRRLGGFTRYAPVPSLRQTALAAAEKRARLGSLLPSGPRRLGGDGDIMSALSPIQAAAMAAERRIQDEVWCGSGASEILSELDTEGSSSDKSKQEFAASSKTTSKSSIVTDSRDSERKRKSSYLSSSISGMSLSGNSSSHQASDEADDRPIWECSICTLFNQPIAPVCEACGASKPKAASAKYTTWSCKFCTLDNDTKLDNCSACGKWRYSYGAPVATYGPNYGT